MRLTNGINDIHNALAHAVYEGFPEFEYEDRDWKLYQKTGEDARIKKSRRHREDDISIYALFPQTWGSTALGFGGVGGQAITSAYTIVLESHQGAGYCVYFGGRFAYRIICPNEQFFLDISNRYLGPVMNASKYEQPQKE